MVIRATNALRRGETEAVEADVAVALKALDKAVTKGILHSNNAARSKSRLMAKLNKLKAA
jgi:small subunit ribosomal protein S20